MGFDPFTAALELGKTVLEKWIPDANNREQAAVAMATQIHLQIMGQIEVNKVEAASSSIFVAGWRPFIGWVCGGAYAYNFVVQPFLVFAITAFHGTLDTGQLPHLDWTEISFVLAGLLGLGAMKSYEKTKGVA
jgi:uncharacterized membrane protein required for colicin V production